MWNAAEVLWGHIHAADYREVIVELIFLRCISTAFDRHLAELVCEGEGFEDDRNEEAFFDAVRVLVMKVQMKKLSLKEINEQINELLKRYKYAPEGQEEALLTVMTLCELWTDNQTVED